MPTSVQAPLSRPRSVLVWRTAWLPPSETFVRGHVDSLQRWRAAAVGFFRRESSLARPTDEILLGDEPGVLLRRLTTPTVGRRRLRRRLLADRPDLIHAHFAHEAVPVLRHARRLRIPLIVTLHGWDVTAGPRQPGRRGARHRRRIRAVFRSATTVLAVSEYIAEQAVRHGADPAKVVVHYLGIPLPEQLHAADDGGAEPCDVLFAGRLVEKKGVADLLDALERSAPTARTVIVGDGPLRAELERDARARSLDVEFTGMLPPEALRRRLEQAKVFAAPSRTAADGDAEGFGLVFLEAAAAGLPVVAYAHGGVPEAVQDGVTGLLAPEGHVAALGDALDRLLTDEELRRTLGDNAARRVVAEFDIRRRAGELERLYGRLVGDALEEAS